MFCFEGNLEDCQCAITLGQQNTSLSESGAQSRALLIMHNGSGGVELIRVASTRSTDPTSNFRPASGKTLDLLESAGSLPTNLKFFERFFGTRMIKRSILDAHDSAFDCSYSQLGGRVPTMKGGSRHVLYSRLTDFCSENPGILKRT